MPAALPYQDPTLPIAERVADLVGRMTLPEKVGQMLQLDARGRPRRPGAADMHVGSILHASPERHACAPHELTAQTRLGIPLLVGEDCIHGHSFWEGATIYPTQLGMAASLGRRPGRAGRPRDGRRGRGDRHPLDVLPGAVHRPRPALGPGGRDVRRGPASSSASSPRRWCAATRATDWTDPTAILATAKHFAGYSETQGGRDASEADISRRKLRSWFLPPFERVAREGCRTFMLGYQTIDGVPITVNDWLLNDVLRGEWGYTGTLVTDWDNVGRMVWEQKVLARLRARGRRRGARPATTWS